MSLPESQLFESALSLPESQRADLAFQLLQSLAPPGDELSNEEFAVELHGRIDAHCRGELQSFTLDETRDIVQQRLQDKPS